MDNLLKATDTPPKRARGCHAGGLSRVACSPSNPNEPYSGACRKVIGLAPEPVIGFDQNQWSACTRLGDRLPPESLIDLDQITHTAPRITCGGLCVFQTRSRTGWQNQPRHLLRHRRTAFTSSGL